MVLSIRSNVIRSYIGCLSHGRDDVSFHPSSIKDATTLTASIIGTSIHTFLMFS